MASFDGRARVPAPANEPIRAYAPGSADRASLKARLDTMASEQIEIPVIIGGREIRTGDLGRAVMPHDHAHVLGTYHKATPEMARQAAAAALAAHAEWSSWAFEDRAAVLLKAAELLRTTWRDTINAATMLGQSKTAFQAEIDAACEIIDFWRFNAHFAEELLSEQPVSDHTMWNRVEYRALEGFVYAVTPFNFTSIAANLPTAPALMGNTVVWKPASSAMFSAYFLMKLLEAAGMPPGVINFLPGNPGPISEVLLEHRDLAGVHFTGSTEVFNHIWRTVGAAAGRYRSYPRVVGETGGKDFILAHASADPASLAVAVVRGGYEFQGQKCSAASRIYVPRSLWPDVRERIVAMIRDIRVGDVRDFRNFMGAVIDEKAFDRISAHIADARQTAQIVAGGGCDKSRGYFIEPTLVETGDPSLRQLCEEIFGPVVTAYAYNDHAWGDTLQLVDRTSPYALTGAVFAQDRRAVVEASRALRYSAGNFYINDKPTGAVVGQQPFGGARGSGTNDKAGSKLNLMRWVSARTVKENFNPPSSYRYPFMDAE
ncbi:MAG: L-glutamate gamma-semialdehyde dehydrogenase [Vicinamibacterales bacterium]